MSDKYVAQSADGCVWITGASSGIGRQLALSFASDGWTVAATARSQDKLDALAGESAKLSGKIIAVPGDVSSRDEMRSACERVENEAGPIALLVANAGVYYPQDGLNNNADEWQKTIDINLTGTVNTILPVIDTMKARRRGQIAIVSSVAGYRGLPTSAAYGATKAALINMAEALKFDLDLAGIRIQVINPGFVDTPATKSNPFPMPHLLSPEEAVAEIRTGLKHPNKFEIAFPAAFVRQLKLLQTLPYGLYFKLVRKSTGWSKKQA
ncbi:NADP-dependent 3-hydroxy acid dehydrogenase YdfG [Roseibium hamelinense]|uniref:NADP-dependent 3-hydroxy acid dehydrogenase YdfG n=1 Tax=Roseibium hamelinense TaxID=150831 RepID=A0A562TGL2_9HYPH|nr:SDR family NAD(P)-dependent oxidoreductase [Roseibium hamelinense]MTI46060.1 SDR family NAD(P)-dependent oxidoreductase [Roseibium hamelinense]TWI92747.1 NADP-dependent 3-hydroxy acid dehydrogenase YdfG [Roseibium hamelinense]